MQKGRDTHRYQQQQIGKGPAKQVRPCSRCSPFQRKAQRCHVWSRSPRAFIAETHLGRNLLTVCDGKKQSSGWHGCKKCKLTCGGNDHAEVESEDTREEEKAQRMWKDSEQHPATQHTLRHHSHAAIERKAAPGATHGMFREGGCAARTLPTRSHEYLSVDNGFFGLRGATCAGGQYLNMHNCRRFALRCTANR